MPYDTAALGRHYIVKKDGRASMMTFCRAMLFMQVEEWLTGMIARHYYLILDWWLIYVATNMIISYIILIPRNFKHLMRRHASTHYVILKSRDYYWYFRLIGMNNADGCAAGDISGSRHGRVASAPRPTISPAAWLHCRSSYRLRYALTVALL